MVDLSASFGLLRQGQSKVLESPRLPGTMLVQVYNQDVAPWIFLQARNGLEGSPGACHMSLQVLSLQMGKGREVVLALATSSIQ